MILLHRTGPAAQNISQAGQDDPNILYLKARRLMHRGREAEAGAQLNFLAGQEISPVLKRLVQEDLAVLRGEGPWVKRFENGLNRFFREAADPAMVGGMAAGQLIFAPVRVGILHALWNPAAKRYLLGSLGSRFFAAGVASAVEAPVFWGVGKGIEQRIYHGGRVSLDLRDGIKEMVSLGATMGVLRLSGFGARTLLPDLFRLYPSVISGAASVGGLYLAHWGQEQVGWRENHGNWSRLTDALVGTFQFGMTGAAVHRMLGSRFQNFNARLEYLLELRKNTPPRFPQIFPEGDPSLAWAGGTSGYRMVAKEFSGRPQINLAKISDAPNYGGRILTDPTQIFIAEVLTKGNQSELSRLKDLVLETYEKLGFKPSERIARYFNTKDWEDWKTGISVLAIGNETTPLLVAQTLREREGLKKFQEQWEAQPHFRGTAEIELRTYGSISRYSFPTPKYLERMVRSLFENPVQAKLKSFIRDGLGILRTRRNSGEPVYEWEHVQSPSGGALSIGRVENIGILVEFNQKGFLHPPIYLFPVPTSDWVKATAETFNREGIWEILPIPSPEPKPKGPSKVRPKDKDRPEVTVEFFAGSHGGFGFNQVLRIIKTKLTRTPHEKTVNVIRSHYDNRDHNPVPEIVNLAGGEKAYILSILYGGTLNGLVLRFDPAGKLISPVYMGNNLEPDWVQNTAGALKAGKWTPAVSNNTPVPPTPLPPPPVSTPVPPPISSWPSTKPLPPEPPFLPLADEPPANFALRLIHESQNAADSRQLKLAKTLEGLLQSPETQGFGLETVARIWGMTRHLTSTGQAAVRKFDLDGLREPLVLYRPPMASLPEPWSQIFAQEIRAEINKTGRIDFMVELGSDTGWLSLYLHQLGLAREIAVLDPREWARTVGRVNLAINRTGGSPDRLRFGKVSPEGGLPIPPGVNLMVAAVPVVGTPLKENGWSLLARALHPASAYLKPGGRILIGIEGPQDFSPVWEMLKNKGYQPSVRLSPGAAGESKNQPAILEGNVLK